MTFTSHRVTPTNTLRIGMFLCRLGGISCHGDIASIAKYFLIWSLLSIRWKIALSKVHHAYQSTFKTIIIHINSAWAGQDFPCGACSLWNYCNKILTFSGRDKRCIFFSELGGLVCMTECWHRPTNKLNSVVAEWSCTFLVELETPTSGATAQYHSQATHSLQSCAHAL